jgi:hypothetical protein
MQPPQIFFSDINLLLIIGAITLLVAAELTSPYHGLLNLKINKKKLQNAAIATGIVFLLALSMQIAFIVMSS